MTLRQALLGAAAGAAGTAALNAVTYLDMAVRGRAASSTPEDSVQKLVHAAGAEIPGDPQTRANRLAGLGPLAGLATGVTVGVGYGLTAATLGTPRPLPGGLLVALAAIVAANAPMTVMGTTDPRSWSVADWVSDVVPHLAYGLVASFTYAAGAD